MPFFKEQKDNLEFQFEKPNVNFLVDEQSEAVRLYKLLKKLDFSEYRKPDHSTIARFLKKFRKEIFGLLPQLISIAKENKISSFNSIAIDGSKFQSSSSKKHSMRMQSLEKEEEIIVRKMKKLMNLVEENDKKENRDKKKLKRLEAEKKKLEQRKQKVEASKTELAKRQESIREKEKRENHQINIEEPDARMMKEINSNGYNVQLSVDSQSEIIVSVSVEPDRSDNHQFSKQHQNIEKILGEDKQREYIADGGYISSETIDYVEDKEVNAYINDSKEIKIIPEPERLLERGKIITSEFFIYSKEDNEYICPNQRRLKEVSSGVYESEDCRECIIKHLCARKRDVRRITRTEFTERNQQMREKIKQSPEKMNQRKVVERVFGNIKWNLGFRRKNFEGASIEIMMLVLALNLKKLEQFLLFLSRILLVKYQKNNYMSWVLAY